MELKEAEIQWKQRRMAVEGKQVGKRDLNVLFPDNFVFALSSMILFSYPSGTAAKKVALLVEFS